MQDLDQLRCDVTNELTFILEPYAKICQVVGVDLINEMHDRVERYLKDLRIQDRIVDYQVSCKATEKYEVNIAAMYKALNDDGVRVEMTIDVNIVIKQPSFEDDFSRAMKGI